MKLRNTSQMETSDKKVQFTVKHHHEFKTTLTFNDRF